MANIQNNVRYGDLGAFPLAQLGEKRTQFDEPTIEREYIDVLTEFATRMPQQFEEHPVHDDFELLSYDYEVIAHDRVRVRLFYTLKPVMDVSGPTPVPIQQIAHYGSTMMEALQRWPGYKTQDVGGGKTLEDLWDADLGMIGTDAPVDLRGMSGYYIGSFQTTVTKFSKTAFTNLASLVGKRVAPPGGGGTNKNWFVLTGSQKGPSAGSPWYTQTVVYQYASLGWPDLIYK